MKKLLLLFFIFTVHIFASKPYLVMVSQSNCPVCIETIEMIKKDKKLAKALREYTEFHIVSKQEAILAGLNIRTTPTFYFFAKEKRALLVAPLEGKPTNANDFIEYLKNVYQKYQNFQNNK